MFNVYMKGFLFQFIPIILVFIFIKFTKNAIIFSHSVLGKLLAICLIVFYTYIDTIFGLLVCAIVIFYYHSEYVEGMLNIHESFESYVDLKLDNETTPYCNCCQDGKHNMKKDENIQAVENFKKDYCVNGKLKYKDIEIKPEMAQHVFPEIKFNKSSCDPCSKECVYSIIESKLKIEKQLIPTSSK